ncbi:MAG: tetratricopeptide repeat protein [Magnetococcales bacterium]|nr:tetratricopeptide repeat protein [Magnetococcales bacterium]
MHLKSGSQTNLSRRFKSVFLILAGVGAAVVPLAAFGTTPPAPTASANAIPPEKFNEYKAAAARGDVQAQSDLGVLYLLGRGVAENLPEALKWLKMAAEKGNPVAQNVLGEMYFRGLGMKKPDDKEAMKWYQKASEQGNIDAQVNLGLMYYMGVGVTADEKKAAELFRQAAEKGNPIAQRHMGYLYAKGEGVPVNRQESQKWYQMAQANGGSPAPGVPGAAAATSPGDAGAAASVPAAPPPHKWQGAGADEAEKGSKALDAGDREGALSLFLAAAEKSPEDEEIQRNVGQLSMDLGKNAQAADYFKRAVVLAVKAKALGRVAEHNVRLRELAVIRPEALEKQTTKVSAPPPGEEAAKRVNAWSAILDQATAASVKGQDAEALKLAQSALANAQKFFGKGHYLTQTSRRDVATYLFRTGQRDKARALMGEAIQAMRKLLGADHPETLAMQIRLGGMLEEGALYPEALKVYTEVQQGYAKSLGADHFDTLGAARAVARIEQDLGHYADSEKRLEAVCQKLTDQLGPYHEERADCLGQLARLQVQGGRYDVAEKSYEQLLTLQGEIRPPTATAFREARLGQAELFRFLARYDQAEGILKEILAAGEKETPPLAGRLLVRTQDLLAQVYEDRGDFVQAEKLMRQVIAQETKALGPEHPDVIASLSGLAGILKRAGQQEAAEKIYNGALQRARKLLGANHQTTIALLNNLGLILEEEGLYDQAEPMFKEALKAGQTLLGEDHPTTIAAMNSLAMLYESQGNFDKARPLYAKTITLSSKRLGREHPDTVAFVNNLAYLDLMRQDYASAARQFQEVVTLWAKTLGEKNPKTLKGMNNLARALHKLSRHDEAEKLFKKTLALREEALGGTHMDTLRSMQDLAALYRDRGRNQEADELFQKTLQLEEKILGPQHPYTFETMGGLAGVKENLKDTQAAFAIRQTLFARRTEFLNRMMWVAGDNAREGYVRLHQPEFFAYLSLLSRLEPEVAGKALLEASLRRKGLLLKISSEVQQVARLSSDPTLGKLANELVQARKELASRTLEGPKEGVNGEEHLHALNALEDRINTLEGDLGRASLRFRQKVAAANMEDLVKELPEAAVLVDFLIYRDGEAENMVAGLLAKENGQPKYGLVVYKDVKEIQKQVVAYRTIIQDEAADEADMKKVGAELHAAVWKPLEPFLGSRSEVFVVPDGILNIMPFNALVDEKDAFLIRGVDLHLLNSSRDLVARTTKPNTGMVTFAGPDYNSEKTVGEKVLAEVRGKRSASAAKGAEAAPVIEDLPPEAEETSDNKGPAGGAAEAGAAGAASGSGGGARRSAALSQLRAGLRAFSVGMRGLRFDPLPGALKEGELINDNVSKAKKEVKLFTQNDAQEKGIKGITSPDILHVATHGFFLKADDNLKKRLLRLQRSAEVQLPPPGDNPLLRSGLAFAGINANAPFLGEIDTENDGVLTALEVMSLNLTGTRLAVLSACETGLGEIHEGEGVYGLRRAFQEAGVEKVMASLWEVSDAGTQALMTGFYKRLMEGKAPQASLRETQLELLGSSQWGHPYIWSAFMMVGK